MTTETSKERCGSLTTTDFSYSQPCCCFMATVSQFDGEGIFFFFKEREKNVHAVRMAQCLLLFPLQFDGENMYMSMTEPSQDYVPASQVG